MPDDKYMPDGTTKGTENNKLSTRIRLNALKVTIRMIRQEYGRGCVFVFSRMPSHYFLRRK